MMGGDSEGYVSEIKIRLDHIYAEIDQKGKLFMDKQTGICTRCRKIRKKYVRINNGKCPICDSLAICPDVINGNN